ncbi:MAG TPA: BamA/TamA family outer membrane protein [Bryobacteraceae bacterium]
MKLAGLGCLLLGSLLFAGTQDSEFNVNTRYTVETVVVSGDGWTTNLVSDHGDNRISSGLRKEISAIIGTKLNPSALDEIAHRLKKEFHARTVEHHVLRGKSPEYVQVVFEIKLRPTHFDITTPKFVYNSKQGFSGSVEGTLTAGHNGFTFGLVSDGDDLAERYTGLVARYENNRLGTDRVRLGFQFESYHDQWDSATAAALPAPFAETSAMTSGIYRTRNNFEPVATFVIARPLTLSVGASFESFEEQFPAAHTEAANALITTLRYHRRLEGSENQQDLDAGYGLRAATKVLSTDFVYARHHFEFRYQLTRGKQVILDDLTAGLISGRSPLFERYFLGNSSTLRGWNKYELDPVGGNRMVHNSVEYRYGVFQIFYDAGAIWDSGEAAVPRHSVGVGLRQGAFSLAMAFPVREGRIEPIFMVGMNY